MALDYPRVRADSVCPTCYGAKDHGLVVCWECFRSQDMRDGLTPGATRSVALRERVLTEYAADAEAWRQLLGDRRSTYASDMRSGELSDDLGESPDY